MRRVRITRDAKRELDEIWFYIARDDENAATRLLASLDARFELQVIPQYWT